MSSRDQNEPLGGFVILSLRCQHSSIVAICELIKWKRGEIAFSYECVILPCYVAYDTVHNVAKDASASFYLWVENSRK